MANFDEQIQDLVGTFTDQDAMDDWMTHGARELLNVLPYPLKRKCTTFTLLNADNGTTIDLDGLGEIMHVTRENANSGYYKPCREIPAMYGDMSNDSSDLMFYATATDPVYWIDSNSSDAATLFVKPTPTNNQPAKVYHISIPSIDASSVSTIVNFPDEAEYLVVLFASIKAAESLLAIEEDDDLYVPIINTLKSDYIQGLQLLGLTSQGQQKKDSGAISKKQLNKLVEQLSSAQKST